MQVSSGNFYSIFSLFTIHSDKTNYIICSFTKRKITNYIMNLNRDILEELRKEHLKGKVKKK